MGRPYPYCVSTIDTVIGSGRVVVQTVDGNWVRAVPEPYPATIFERLRASWWVATGRANAFVWPSPEELNAAIARAEGPAS